MRLKALQQFANELITGVPGPRCYREEAAEDIKALIKKWVADAQPKADSGIHKYFKAGTR